MSNKSKASEWKKFCVGVPAERGFNPDCLPFDSVSHVCHVGSGISIIEEGRIIPTLVFDESKLNDRRILVVWLSPNGWANGYRYGTVRFNFTFSEVIDQRNYYWVEDVGYKIPACRILITDKDRESDLIPYDPTKRNGPWWYDTENDQHYYNGTYCLEFMVEAPVSLQHLKKLDFVEHHPNWCSVHRSTPDKCAELGFRSDKGGARFMTRAITCGLDLTPYSSQFVNTKGKPESSLEGAFHEFAGVIARKADFSGSLTSSSPASFPIMRGIMSEFTFGRMEDARTLASLFATEEEFFDLAAEVFSLSVRLDDWKKLLE